MTASLVTLDTTVGLQASVLQQESVMPDGTACVELGVPSLLTLPTTQAPAVCVL